MPTTILFNAEGAEYCDCKYDDFEEHDQHDHVFQEKLRQHGIEFPEDNEDDIGAFVSWAYTGDLLTSHPTLVEPEEEPCMEDIVQNAVHNTPERLWVLGIKLIAPLFANIALNLVRNRYRRRWDPLLILTSCVYENTLPEAKLRLFMKDLLLTEGPLSEHARYKNGVRTTDIVEWIDLLQDGGELVGGCLRAFAVPNNK
jgi:hypothetical protein